MGLNRQPPILERGQAARRDVNKPDTFLVVLSHGYYDSHTNVWGFFFVFFVLFFFFFGSQPDSRGVTASAKQTCLGALQLWH